MFILFSYFSGHSDLERESLLQAIIETINKSNSEKVMPCFLSEGGSFITPVSIRV